MDRHRTPQNRWRTALFTVAGVALLLTIALWAITPPETPQRRQAAVPQNTPTATASDTPSPTVTLTRRARPLETRPRPTRLPTTALTPAPQTAVVTATLGLTTTAIPTPDRDHYWLARPIRAEDTDSIEPYYPYGSKGDGTYPIHHGVEFGNPMGTPVLAVADGTIVVAGDDSETVYGAFADYYGMLVIEQLDERLEGALVYVLYGHLSEINVAVGQRVTTGELIGAVGMSGVAQGPHLHFEVRYGQNSFNATVNPELWLRPHDGCGTLAGAVLASDGRPIPEVWVAVVKPETLEESVREVMTYPAREVNADPRWGENWCVGDLEAGEYEVQAYLPERILTARAVVTAGMTTWVTLR